MIYNIDRELDNKSGVYIIKSTVTNDSYIGSTVNFRKRYAIHKSDFKRNHLTGLTAYCAEHGFETLVMEVLMLADKESMYKIEIDEIYFNKPTLNRQSLDGLTRAERNISSNRQPINMDTNYLAKKSKPVNQLNMSGEFIKSYPSARAAARELGKYDFIIGKALRGLMKSAYGYKWEYIPDNTNIE